MAGDLLISGLLALSTLCTQCGPEVHQQTTQAIIRVESGGNPLAIHDNKTGRSYAPKTKREAEIIAADLLERGHSIDMGLMQINSQHLSKKRISFKDLFDPCVNIKTGTRILADFYRQHAKQGQAPDVTLLKALSAYNTGTPYNGAGYVNKILAAAGSSVRVPVSATAKTTKQHDVSAKETGRSIAFYRKEDNR